MSYDPHDLSKVPRATLDIARRMFDDARRNMMLCGDSTVVMGWWIESHTMGCRNAADEPEENWWSSHWAILEEYEHDGISRIMADQDTGAFVTMTPQRPRKSHRGQER